MSPRRTAAGRLRAARVVIALAAATACVGAVVAYAATRASRVHQGLGGQHAVQQPSGSGPGGSQSHGGNGGAPSRERLLRPQLIEMPPETTTMSDPQFRFNVPPRKPLASPPQPVQANQPPVESSRRFQCRVDGGDWSECRSPHRLSGLAPGAHRFAVRVFNREERIGEPVGFGWEQTAPELAPSRNEQVEPREFSIVALRNPEDLYPSLPPTPIPIRITNPNSVAIEVTEITAAIDEAPADCPAENFELTPAGVSPQDPVLVPANSSVELPDAGAEPPAIRMLNLPVEQDACRGAEIPLVFSGEARG